MNILTLSDQQRQRETLIQHGFHVSLCQKFWGDHPTVRAEIQTTFSQWWFWRACANSSVSQLTGEAPAATALVPLVNGVTSGCVSPLCTLISSQGLALWKLKRWLYSKIPVDQQSGTTNRFTFKVTWNDLALKFGRPPSSHNSSRWMSEWGIRYLSDPLNKVSAALMGNKMKQTSAKT